MMPAKILALILFVIPAFTNASMDIGVATHLSDYNQSSDDYRDIIKSLGFDSVRDGFSWNSVQNEAGKLNISKQRINSDNFFAMNSRQSDDISTLFVLGYGNNLYTHGGYPQNREQVDKFVDYVAWVATRYKGKVKYYEIWNEWLLGTGVGSKRNKPDDEIFLYLVKKSSEKIKQIDPSAVVLTGSVNPLHKNEVNWLNGLIDKGLMNYVDGISIHPYAFNEPASVRDPEGSFIALDSFEASLTNRVGKAVSLYITEMGYPTGSGFTGGVSNIISAQNMVKYTLLAVSKNYVKGLWWYDLMDDGPDKKNKEHNFGLLYRDGSEKESAQLIKKLLPLIRNKNLLLTSSENQHYVITAQEGGQLVWERGQNYSVQQWLIKINGLNH
ncbi:family 1 glycosylhydrolase [Rahnella sp. EDr1-12]|uniref:family 1 glycosylhydrolase n=1 Tax=unclassified Rahnella TaxID=2635087 RepID=UPI003BA93F2F